MAMLKINGVVVQSPAVLTWDIFDQSSEESGRSTNDGRASKDIISRKRKLSCAWNNIDRAEASKILKAVSEKAFFSVYYPDSLSGNYETRTFYVGDRSTPFKIWTTDYKVYSSLTFNLVER